MAAVNDFCFFHGHEINVDKRDCHFCSHCGTTCLKMIFAIKLERDFFYDKPKHISEVEGRYA